MENAPPVKPTSDSLSMDQTPVDSDQNPVAAPGHPKLVPVLAGLSGAALLAAVVWYMFIAKNRPNDLGVGALQKFENNANSTSSSTTIDTEPEKTATVTNKYTSSVDNYMFEYPEEMEVNDKDYPQVYIVSLNAAVGSSAQTPSANVTVRKLGAGETVQSIINQMAGEANPETGVYYSSDDRTVSKVFGNLNGIEFTNTTGFVTERSFIAEYNGYVVTITAGPIADAPSEVLEKTEKLYYQILSTFKFLN